MRSNVDKPDKPAIEFRCSAQSPGGSGGVVVKPYAQGRFFPEDVVPDDKQLFRDYNRGTTLKPLKDHPGAYGASVSVRPGSENPANYVVHLTTRNRDNHRCVCYDYRLPPNFTRSLVDPTSPN